MATSTTYEVSSPTTESPMTYEKKLEPTVLETQPTFPPSEEKGEESGVGCCACHGCWKWALTYLFCQCACIGFCVDLATEWDWDCDCLNCCS
ncbi:hypothetical protein TWF481_011279 [Arthrobotrys musiformis]|uniref:LITAF domain-containing protein n=1 Tax=Arthrobotrys musiformis TaxID=47236 RepID=A0AAV9VXU3_9PEZI